MTTNKPEVVAEVHQHLNNLVVDWKSRASESVCAAGDQLIRLSDYEKLAAECEKLRSAVRSALVVAQGVSHSSPVGRSNALHKVEVVLGAVIQGDTSEGS